ncbi:cytochrome P450 [Thozetella sp. PMI_491]|nr:cytochrome P450 [Thozetella sp. PMI_491]
MVDRLVSYTGAAVLASLIFWIYARVSNKGSLPPGPKGLPLIGNIRDLPPKGLPEWQHWIKHKDKYGPISSVKVLGQPIILLHSREAAVELLEKRSTKHSSRPHMIFASEMVGYSKEFAMRPYDRLLREQRKLVASQLGHQSSVQRFEPKQALESRRFLLRLLREPGKVESHFYTESASVILDMLYGYSPRPGKRDPLVDLIMRVMNHFGQASVAGVWMVDFLPWIRYLPDWVPGTGFKRTARDWGRELEESVNVPLQFVEHQMRSDQHKSSYVSELIGTSNRRMSAEEHDNIRYSAGTLYAGGSDTTPAALEWFLIAMVKYPDVQRKARKDIDSVVGSSRLPGFEDRARLPYVEAIVQETLRWQPLAPLGLPHMTDQDDYYQGYLIPKGALILPSIASFAQDPEVYHDPGTFKPERFLEPYNEPLPLFTFGFGRRVCPGRLLANSTMFITIAQILAAFTIDKAADARDDPREPEVQATPGIVSRPLPFQYTILPRNEAYINIIKQVETEHPWEEGDAELLEKLTQEA